MDHGLIRHVLDREPGALEVALDYANDRDQAGYSALWTALVLHLGKGSEGAQAALVDLLERRKEGRAAAMVGARILSEMIWCGPGSFLMGSPDDEEGRWGDEGPQHTVTLTRGFWLLRTPVTQAMWCALQEGENPSKFKGPDRPVERVDWNQCRAWCSRLEEIVPGVGWGLPSEAEWEYACRAGSEGPGGRPLDSVAWHSGNSGGQTHPVGEKEPNAWGFHDMLGNVWEWCLDGVDDLSSTYTRAPRVDPVGGVDPLGCSVAARGSTSSGTCVRSAAAPSRGEVASSTSASGSSSDPRGPVRGVDPLGCCEAAPGSAAPGTYARRTAAPSRLATGTPSSASGSSSGCRGPVGRVDPLGCCEAAPGTSGPGTCAVPADAGTIQGGGTRTSASGSSSDPRGPVEGSCRVIRGGSWYDNAGSVRAAYRLAYSPGFRYGDLGFRLAASLIPPPS